MIHPHAITARVHSCIYNINNIGWLFLLYYDCARMHEKPIGVGDIQYPHFDINKKYDCKVLAKVKMSS